MSPISGNGSNVQLNNIWTVKQLPIFTRGIVAADDLKDFTYLSDLTIPQVKADRVMLLIGTDFPEAHIPLEVRSGCSHEPYAVRTRLGWAVRGPVPQADVKQNTIELTMEAVNI